MCDIAAERAKIDLLLLDSLRETAPDQCVARRVEAFVEAVVAGGVMPGDHEHACG